MRKESLKLKELTIDRMPGFPRGLHSYRGFSPQINIIAGPNASGKSTTARAIQKLIWRNQTGGLQLDGKIDIGNELWSVRIDSDRHTIQRDGVEDELAGLPSLDDKSRYMLALHELVKADEGDLAKQIIRESIGGYDIEYAKENLSYEPGIKTQNISEFKKLRDTKQIVRKQEKNQQEIKKKEEQLEGLYAQKKKAAGAVKQKELYEIVLQYLQTKETVDRLKNELTQYPAALSNAHEEIYNNIVTLENELREAKSRQDKSRNKIDEFRNSLNEINLPEAGISDSDLLELEERIEKLSELDGKIQDLRGEIRNCADRKEKALANLSANGTEVEWKGLELEDVGELEQFLERAHRTGSTKKFLETEIEQLREELSDDMDSRAVRDGIGYLNSWLQEPDGRPVLPDWIFWLIIVFTIGAVVISGLVGIVGMAVLIVVIGIAAYALWKNRRGQKQNQWKVRQQKEYEELGLRTPETWDAEGVRHRLRELVKELQQAEWQNRIQIEMEKRTSQLKNLEKEIAIVETEADKLKEKLGALPDLPFELPQSYTELTWFLIQAQRWQKASEEESAFGSQMEGIEEELQIELDRCNKLFERYRLEPASDVTQGIARLKSLNKQEEKRRSTVDQIKAEERIIEDQQRVIDDRTGQLHSLYSKMNVEFGNPDEVKQLLDQLDKYKKLDAEYKGYERQLFLQKEQMENHPKYEDHEKHIKGLRLDQVKKICDDLSNEAEKYEKVNKEIQEIVARVNTLQGGNTLEDALAAEEEALFELKSKYVENVSSIAGDLIVEHLKKEIREQNRPKVFEEANGLFNRITKGKYEIRVDERSEEFIAYDTVARISKKLDELSTGSRIQLLISVRLAFVETKENAVKLPILADELLANSDDLRAKAIIEALIEISRDGRQVFYFTAQADEVTKWKTFLSAEEDIKFEVFELDPDPLGEGYFSQRHEKIDLPGFMHEIPGANGMSYEEYGKLLNVRPFDLLVHNSFEIHLWYLLDDLELLQECLANGLNRWGALQSFLDHGGKIVGMDPDRLALLEEKIRLLEKFQNDYQMGRPKPIDRNILEASGAVSDTFINDVSEKLEEVDRDPELLLEMLRAGEVSRFQSGKIDELENYLTDHGYIDNREKLPSEEINIRLQAAVSGMQISPDEAQAFMDRVLKG